MDKLNGIFEAIKADGFSESTLLQIDKYVNDIKNGTEDFPRFNLPEHAGLCTAGAPLIGASIIACYATASLTAGSHVEGSQGSPANLCWLARCTNRFQQSFRLYSIPIAYSSSPFRKQSDSRKPQPMLATNTFVKQQTKSYLLG